MGSEPEGPSSRLILAGAATELSFDAGWPTAYDPVVALAVIREAENSEEILVGVRDPATNKFHPDVVSVPTRRIPVEVAAALVASEANESRSPLRAPALDRYVAREVFEAKLGFGDSHEMASLLDVHLHRIDFGDSLIGVDEDGSEVTERLGMFGIEVRVQKDIPVPAATESYSHLMWIPLDQFLLLAVTRDATMLPLGLKAAEVCVHGLCMRSATEIVRSRQPALL